MHVIETTVEVIDAGRIKVITTIDIATGDDTEPPDEIGAGPTGDAIPDRIVRALIDQGQGSVWIRDLQSVVGGNAATVQRQAWTLATNAPDLQKRLRGWVMSAGRGRYMLTPAARLKVEGARSSP